MGAGPCANHVMSDLEREPSVLCHGWPGHPTPPIPHPDTPPPPSASPVCASSLGVSFELQVADSWFRSSPPCCFSLLECRLFGVEWAVGGLVEERGVTFLSQPIPFVQLVSVHKQLWTVSSMSALAHHLMSTFCSLKTRSWAANSRQLSGRGQWSGVPLQELLLLSDQHSVKS